MAAPRVTLELPSAWTTGVPLSGQIRVESGGELAWVADPRFGGGGRVGQVFVELKALYAYQPIRLEPGAQAEVDLRKTFLGTLLRDAGPGEVRVEVTLAWGKSEERLDRQLRAEAKVRMRLPSFLEPLMEALGIDLAQEERIRSAFKRDDAWAFEKVRGGPPALVDEWISWILTASPAGAADAGALSAMRALGPRGLALAERYAESCPAHRLALRILRFEKGTPEAEDAAIQASLRRGGAPIAVRKLGGHPWPGDWRTVAIEGEGLRISFDEEADRSKNLRSGEREALLEALARSGIWLAAGARMPVADEPTITLEVGLPEAPIAVAMPEGQWRADPRSRELAEQVQAWVAELKRR